MEDAWKFKVNLGGMIDILSHHLYSSPDVFVRELLQNGVDAISARIAQDEGFREADAGIEIEVQEGERILFRDNGTGLNEEEIHRFLAVIGQSSKYDIAARQTEGDYIGRFGIGLLSCFMVTDEILVRTRSFRCPETVREWRGHADGTYTIAEVAYDMPVGTEVVLCCNKTGVDEDEAERVADYYDDETIANLVLYYGLFLPYPVSMNVAGEKQRLNNRFLFDTEGQKEACMEAGKLLLGEEFMDCFRLRSPSGLFDGVAYVIPYPVSAAAHHLHRIYLKNMLLTLEGDKLLPEWSFFLRCVINADGLKPTSSREDFYQDEMLEKAREEIEDCIADYLAGLDMHHPEMLHAIVSVHNLAVKSVIASTDSLDEMLLPYIAFETSLGAMTGRDICNFGGNGYYTTDINQFRQLAPLYTQRSMLLINAGYVYENILMQKLAHISERTLLDEVTESDLDFLLDGADCEGSADGDRLCRVAGRVLRKYDCTVSLRQFEPYDIPALFHVNEAAEESRRIRQSMESADELFQGMLSAFQNEIAAQAQARACLFLNAHNVIVRKMLDMDNDDKLRCYVEILYVQALLSGHFPLLHGEMQVLNENLCRLMEF